MINAGRIATELVGMLPENETPETTEGYEGFFHLTGISGTCEQAQLAFIIRDHDREFFESRKMEMLDVVEAINEKYGEEVATLELKDQYYNMREKLEDKMYIIDIAKQAMIAAGIETKIKAIRGGTDGAQLSFKGLPCPNIFAGGLNFHGRHEFVPIQSMQKAMMTVVNICRIVAE
jgi:tripeptide aminopeptidase